MANTKTQMAEGIASLVRGQRFAGSGVWRQSGNATLRIETQTNSIVEALTRLPSMETQEEEERESDRQHEELISAIESNNIPETTSTEKKKGGGLLAGLMGGLAFKTLGSSLKGLFNFLKPLGLIFAPLKFLLKPITWLVGGKNSVLGSGLTKFIRPLFFGLGGLAAVIGALGIATILGFDPENEEEAKKYFKSKTVGYSESIATLAGSLVSGLIDGAILLWNELIPGLKVSDEKREKLKEGTFKFVTDTVFSIVDFFEKLGTGFSKGFAAKKGEETLSQKGERFGIAITNLSNSLSKLGEQFQEIFKDVEFSFNHSEKGNVTYKGIEGVGAFLGNIAYDIIGGLIDLATEITNFLANPSDYIGELPGRIKTSYTEAFKEARERDAERKVEREAGGPRGPLNKKVVALESQNPLERFGITDFFNSIQLGIRDAILPEDLVRSIDDKAVVAGGNVNFDQSVNPVTSNSYYLGSPQTRSDNATGSSSSKNRGGKD